jgi:beta-glucosidase
MYTRIGVNQLKKRVEDLVSQMTLTEKAGMLLINTLNADLGGVISDDAPEYIEAQKWLASFFGIRLLLDLHR